MPFVFCGEIRPFSSPTLHEHVASHRLPPRWLDEAFHPMDPRCMADGCVQHGKEGAILRPTMTYEEDLLEIPCIPPPSEILRGCQGRIPDGSLPCAVGSDATPPMPRGTGKANEADGKKKQGKQYGKKEGGKERMESDRNSFRGKGGKPFLRSARSTI